METPEIEAASMFFLLIFSDSVDDGPAQGIAHGDGRRLAIPVEIRMGLGAGKVELAHHELSRLLVGHPTRLGLYINDDSQRPP